jgi:DNA ligase 4
MQRIYNRTTPEEQRWIVRIILKGAALMPQPAPHKCPDGTTTLDIGISVKEATVFSVFHPDAQDLFNTCSDLKKVAWELWDSERRLNDQVHLTSLLCFNRLSFCASG